MVKVVVVTVQNDPITLEFKNIYSAGGVMQALSDSVVGGCAFMVSFKKEEPESRFTNPEELTEVPAEELTDLEDLLKEVNHE